MGKKSDVKDNSHRRIFQAKLCWTACIIGQLIIFFLLAFPGDYSGKVGYGARESHEFNRRNDSFGWYVIPLTTMTLFYYFKAIGKGDWDTILAAVSFILIDFFVEIWNALFYTRTGFAAPWICNQKRSAYQLMIGWNIEIIINFLVAPVACLAFVKNFDKEKAYFGINNRHLFAFCFSCTHFGIEIFLNYFDALLWNFWWWDWKMPFLPFLCGYFPFYELLFNIYDAEKMSTKIITVVVLALVTFPPFIVFVHLGWV